MKTKRVLLFLLLHAMITPQLSAQYTPGQAGLSRWRVLAAATGPSMVYETEKTGAAGQMPAAHAGPDQAVTLPASSVQLSGSAVDADGTIVAYEWQQVSGPGEPVLTTPHARTTTVSGLVPGTYTFSLTVTDNSGATGTDAMQVTVSTCAGTRRTVTPWSDGGIYFSGKPGAFSYLAYQPGDTFVLSASRTNWSYFTIEDFHGTPGCPIVVINEGGQVQMTKGIEVKNSSDIKVTGSGSSDFYGFYVHNPADNDNSGVAIGVQGRSRNIEVERISVRKKTYGAWIKQDPTCVDSLNYPAWHMDNVKIHDCKFLNIGQDCIYAGNTDPAGLRGMLCNGANTNPIPMRLSNIHIYNLIIDSCMRTGIQLSGCDSGYNSIHDNIVTRCGYELNQQQGTGISIGGTTKNCYVYNNTINATFLYGILSVGAGNNYIEDNSIDSSGYLDGVPNNLSNPSSIYVDTRQTVPYDSSRIFIRNNRLGLNCNKENHDIFFEKSFDAFATGNVICNNLKQDHATPATYYLRAGIHWIECEAPPAGNLPPIANAGIDQAIPVSTPSVTLFGSAMDKDGTIVAVSWSKIAGPARFSFIMNNQPHAAVGNLEAGVYEFEMKVTDDKGSMDRDTMILVVKDAAANPVNLAPRAVAGADVTITLPANSVTLQGSGTDADGTITAYAWTKISGPAAAIGTPAQARTVVGSLLEGLYAFELRVTDNAGATGKDTVVVKVNAAVPGPTPNKAPVARAGTDISITLPVNSATLSGSGTDTDGTIAAYSWTKVSGPAGAVIISAAQAQTTVSSLLQGTYTFELKVTDNGGAIGRDTVAVTVHAAVVPPPNKAPVARAGADVTITLPVNSVTLQGSGTDADGTIAAYSWTKVSGPAAAIGTPAQAQTTVSSLVQGIYSFELKVTDNGGATGKDTVKVTVNAAAAEPAANKAPVARAGTDISITLPVNSAILSGGGTDTDGTIAAYTWTKIGGPAAYAIASPAQAQTAVSGLTEGVYRFELKVTDDKGATGRDSVVVTVLRSVTRPALQLYVGEDRTLTLPIDSLTLEADTDNYPGTITHYKWRKISGPPEYKFSHPNLRLVHISRLREGTYLFACTATDTNGNNVSDTMQVTVTGLLAPKLSLYPNPSRESITLRMDAMTDQSVTSIRIFNVRGAVVYEERFLREERVVIRQIDISRLQQGPYFVKINADFHSDVSAKFMKE